MVAMCLFASSPLAVVEASPTLVGASERGGEKSQNLDRRQEKEDLFTNRSKADLGKIEVAFRGKTVQGKG